MDSCPNPFDLRIKSLTIKEERKKNEERNKMINHVLLTQFILGSVNLPSFYFFIFYF